ncbi:hypothetical protein ACFXI8_27410 [Streptomyces niveus]
MTAAAVTTISSASNIAEDLPLHHTAAESSLYARLSGSVGPA